MKSFLVAGIIGMWYSAVLSFEAFSAVRDLSLRSADEHYVVELTFALGSVFIAAVFAAANFTTKAIPIALTAATPSLVSAMFLLLLTLNGATEARSPYSLLALWPISALVSSFLAGKLVQRSARHQDNFLMQIMPVSRVHWSWVWIPMAIWIYLLISSIYLLWLAAVTDVYWAMHPSLWFTKWFTKGLFATVLSLVGSQLLWRGVLYAMNALSGDEYGLEKKSAILSRFAWNGVVLAIIAAGACLRIAFLNFVDLSSDISQPGHPWWIL